MKALADFRVGETFSLVRECDRYRPIYYGAAAGDFNPLHIDPEAGRAAGLGGPILQGMCTYAWLAEACAAYFGSPARVRRLRARFSRPVAPGDVVAFRGRCVEVRPDAVLVEVEARNQRGEEVLTGARAEGSLA